MAKSGIVYVYGEDGIHQACRDMDYVGRFALESEDVFVGVGASEEDAIEELHAKEDAEDGSPCGNK